MASTTNTKTKTKTKTATVRVPKATPTSAFYPKLPLPKIKPDTQRKPFVDSEDIPSSYNKTGLTLVARDPRWIYAHWEITPGSLDEMRRDLGQAYDGSALTLRMYDTTLKDFDGNNANSWFDTDINLSTNNWYVNPWNDKATYCGAVGVRTRDGQFHTLVRSNFVSTPSANAAWRSDMIWMEVPPAKKGRTPLRGRRPFVKIGKAPERKGQLPRGKRFGRKIYLTADDIRAYYFNLFPLLRLLRAKQSAARGQDVGSWGSEKLTRKDLESSSYIPGMHQTGEHYRKIRVGASEELVESGGASEQYPVGASERTQKKRNFFFEIGTELIVYGRTEPNAEVRLGEKVIPLRADGTFSMRFALPVAGNIPLDFTATSADKAEQRTITTSAHRSKTMYGP